MTKNYVNLHNHLHTSFLDGLSNPQGYLGYASELGMTHAAVTDHGSIHSWPDFYDAAQEVGIRPLLGEEFYQSRGHHTSREEIELASGANDELEQRGPYHLTVFAADEAGYKNVIKLSSKAYTEGNYGKPRISFDLIEEHSKGLVVLSGCLSGGVCQALMRDDKQAAIEFAAKMQDIVGKDNYFIEVMDHTIEEERQVLGELVDIAKIIGSKVVPTCDSHYTKKEDSFTHDALLCISTGSRLHEEDRFRFVQEEFYLRSYDEMLTRFPAEWLSNTLEVADKINVDLKRGEFYFPEYDVPTDENLEDHFDRLVWDGVRKIYGDTPSDEVVDRIYYELRTVKRLGFVSYFLVIADLVNYADTNGIKAGPGRGSSAGSLISYVLGITKLDPLEYGLLFERFLVPEEAEYAPKFEMFV